MNVKPPLDHDEMTDRRLCSILATGREERMHRCGFKHYGGTYTWRWYSATDPGAHTPPSWRPASIRGKRA